jgi:hypothetical protein
MIIFVTFVTIEGVNRRPSDSKAYGMALLYIAREKDDGSYGKFEEYRLRTRSKLGKIIPNLPSEVLVEAGRCY